MSNRNITRRIYSMFLRSNAYKKICKQTYVLVCWGFFWHLEKTILDNYPIFLFFFIISIWKKAWPLIWINLKAFLPRILNGKFGWNWLINSREKNWGQYLIRPECDLQQSEMNRDKTYCDIFHKPLAQVSLNGAGV